MTVKSILITGASSGIGYDAAVTLRDRGWRVFASCRKTDDCARLQSEGFESPRLDYEDEATLKAALGEVLSATGGTLSALFNNGAYGIPGLLEDMPTEAMRTIFQANLIGYHDLTRQVIPVMRAHGHGRILNCSSVLGYAWYPWRGAYVATKYALEGMTDVLRVELHDDPIHVVLIQPGLIDTPFGKNSQIQFEKWIDWEKSPRAAEYERDLLGKWRHESPNARREAHVSTVTKKVVHALESRKPYPRYKITLLAHVIRGVTRVLPTQAADWVVRRSA